MPFIVTGGCSWAWFSWGENNMTRVTCHVTIVTTKMASDKDADAFMLLYFFECETT